jgi:hypothetical protein
VLATSAKYPVAVLPVPVVLKTSVLAPEAVLAVPIVLLKSAWAPEAVLPLPIVLLKSANHPVAVLLSLSPALKSAWYPAAVLEKPEFFTRDPEPIAVLPPESLVTELHPGAAHVGVCACTTLVLSARTIAKVQWNVFSDWFAFCAPPRRAAPARHSSTSRRSALLQKLTKRNIRVSVFIAAISQI